MKQFDVYEAQSVIEKSIGYMIYEDKDTLIALLRKNGVQIPDNVSNDELIAMTYVAVAKSLQFKKDLAKYIASKGKQEFEGYVDEEFFNLTKEEKQAKQAARQSKIKEQGGTKVGNLVRSVATEDTIQSLINTGLGVVSQKLTAKADKASIQAATQLASEKSKQALAEAAAEDAKKRKIKSWVLPVVIGVVVIAGIATFIIIRKKRKA